MRARDYHVSCYEAPVSAPTFAQVLTQKRILVCVGSGGVGKTTTAATIALSGARRGRKTLVITIDPAKRLANSLGLPQLDHEERQVPRETIAAAGPSAPGGALYAMMLDQKRAFDEIVERYASDPGAMKRILDNRIYQQISGSLTGSHEYAAMAKLDQLARERDYDLIVVDTPPTAHALDFLDAPEKVAGAIDSPALDWFIKPLKASGAFSLKLVGVGGSFVLKRVAKFVGSSFLEQMARFFVEFQDVLAGFRERARDVDQLLRSDAVGFVCVAAPETAAVAEALFFHERLVQQRMPFAGFVVNRVHPEAPEAPEPAELQAALAARPELDGLPPYDVARATEPMLAAHRDFEVLAEADRMQVLRLHQAAPDRPLATIPIQERDVHDVQSLGVLAGYLFRS
jgi:anion-transporting  ArsA/GET3 family ATPase